VTGNVFHWVSQQYAFNEGANWLQWLTSIVTVTAWPLAAYTYLHHRCHHCLRPGVVKVRGETHKVCHKHAILFGHTH